MGAWYEVTDPDEIAHCTKMLVTKLQRGTRSGGPFRIGYPNGSFDSRVRFRELRPGKKLWLYSGLSEKSGDYITLVGRYVPDQRGPLLIDIQFNFPKGRFSREKGGAFVKDSSGRAYLAHRGIVTRGKSRIQKAELLRQLNWRKPVVADSAVRPFQVKLLLVGALDDDQLINRVARFAGAMRDAATLAALVPTDDQPSGPQVINVQDGVPSTSSPMDLMLSAYRDEFDGTRVVNRQGQVVMDWSHGRVVKALHQALSGSGDIWNCKAADLIVRNRMYIDLYEVKSSSSSQSVYTAIGQLLFHGAYLEGEFASYTVRKFLVLPGSAKHQARQDRCKELGFNLVTFSATAKGFKFAGLPE